MIPFLPAQTGFVFERPLLAASALVIIPLAMILARRLGSRFIAAVPLGPPGGVPFSVPFSLEKIIRFLRFLEFCGVLLLFAGVAGPVVRTAETVWLNRGADIMFVMDISPSMAALDMGGASRFSVARSLLLDFAERRPADGLGLVGVGNDAALLIPPTMDRGVFKSRLESLELGELGDGTALGIGLAVAAYHIERSTAPRRSVVLISDGENNAGAIHPETAAAMVRDAGASLWVIGIGTGGVVPIDFVDPFTRIRHTGMYDSAFDTESLRRISEAGDGEWIIAPSADAFASAFARIDDQEMVVLRPGTVTRNRYLHPLFLSLALGLVAGTRFIRRFFLGAWL
ncbi:MAG: VWA domain-containing protein [Treponema sp.]|nr:VWA domain-containing protein [Treponema sp.]